MSVRDGTYTVVERADRTYVTVRIETELDARSGLFGKTIASFMSGPDNETSFTNFAFVFGERVAVWKRFRDSIAINRYKAIVEFLANDETRQETAGKRYAMHSGNCYVCNRKLTVPESIAAGIGLVCRRKVAA